MRNCVEIGITAAAPVTMVKSLEDEEQCEVMTEMLRDVESLGRDDSFVVIPAYVKRRICLIVRKRLLGQWKDRVPSKIKVNV